MNGIGNWFRRLGQKLRAVRKRFMMGRYGRDKLNSAILWSGVALVLVAVFIPASVPDLILHLLAYALMCIYIFRALSRNTYKRYRENRKYLMLLDGIRDRNHRYFECPRCRQLIRVPKGKGKISITCPKCKDKFIKKT